MHCDTAKRLRNPPRLLAGGRRRVLPWLPIVVLALLLAACLAEADREEGAGFGGGVPDTWTEIQALFQGTCTACHGTTPLNGNGLRLTAAAYPLIVNQPSVMNLTMFFIETTIGITGVKENSTLYLVAAGDPTAPAVTAADMKLLGEAARIGAWIDAGAPEF